MLALTLKHPWAWAIVDPRIGKDVENRTWRPGLRLCKGDWFAIHGGKMPTDALGIQVVYDEAKLILEDFEGRFEPPFTLRDVILEGIVGVARFGGCVAKSDSPWFEGPVGWVLERVWRLPEPIACRGAQGLWELPDDVYRAVREQYGHALRSEREQQELFA